MINNTGKSPEVYIGLDLGDETSRAYVMDGTRSWLGSQTIPTSMLGDAFREYSSARIVIEVGANSPWVSRVFAERGFEVVVANPRRAQLIAKSYNKSDGADAELLCRQGYSDPEMLSPIQHRSPAVHRDLTLLRSRDALVRSRTLLINHVRGQVKPAGYRVPRCSTAAFPKRVREVIPDDLFAALESVLECITELTTKIARIDELILEACERYPATELLRQVPGVGPMTALCFVLTIEDPQRFKRSRDVGPYLGLSPRKRQSGRSDPEMPITKAGDRMMRQLLVLAAHKTMQANRPDSDLKRFGLRIAGKGSRAAKNRAAVGLARKLAVLLHALWIRGEVYRPLDYGEHDAALLELHASDSSAEPGPRQPSKPRSRRHQSDPPAEGVKGKQCERMRSPLTPSSSRSPQSPSPSPLSSPL